MLINIREAKSFDFCRLEEILIDNNMLTYPEIDGKNGMKRICNQMGKYFLIAESDNCIVGMIRGCYDGSRALVHQMVVDKNYQKQGIGKKMLNEIIKRFKLNGAKSVAVTSSSFTRDYYHKLDFKEVGVSLMIKKC